MINIMEAILRNFYVKFFLAFIFTSSFATHAIAETPKTYVKIEKPADGTFVINSTEASLSELTATGNLDPKVEWSKNAKQALTKAANEYITEKKYKFIALDISDTDDSDALQIVKLNDAVTDSIQLNSFPMAKLPTKTDFDWTIGDGAQKLVPDDLKSENGQKYALFITTKGSYSSGGRKALLVTAMLVGGSIPMGGQDVRASLVDLKDGKVVWYKYDVVSFGTDIRTEEGAKAEIEKLFKELPF